MTRRILLTMLVAALVGMLSLVATGPAGAASGTYLRLAHLSPDTPDVDVSVTSFAGATVVLKGVGYGDVSSYRRIEPGTYTVQMRAAGAPASSPPLVTGTLEAAGGSAYTAAGLGPRAALAVRVLTDDLTPPAAGQARVRVVQGAEQAGDVAIRWNEVPVSDRIAFGSATAYSTVPAGSGTFEVAPASGPAVPIPTQLADGGVYSVIVVERDGRLVPAVKVDAVGTGEMPTGGIETGLGGSAPAAPAAVMTLLAVGLLGFGLVRRVRR
jgi:Domain of unknown function (DUF4397)